MINQQIWSLDSFTNDEYPLKPLPAAATRDKMIKGGGYDPETGAFRDDKGFVASKFETMDFHGFFAGELQGAFILKNRPGGFAPVKNPDSERYDCPETAKTLYNEYEKSFLTNRGAKASDESVVELTPAYAYLDGTSLDETVKGIKKAGKNWKLEGTAKFYASGKYTTIGDSFEIGDRGEFILDVKDEYNKDARARIGNKVRVKEGVKVSIEIKGSGKLIIDDGVEFDKNVSYIVEDGETRHLKNTQKDKGSSLRALQRLVHFKTYLDQGVITDKEYNDYVHHRFIGRQTFINIRKYQGLSERTAVREMDDLKILHVFKPGQLEFQDGYYISVKLTEHEINSLSKNTQKLLNRGSISDALQKGTVIEPEIIAARLEIADIIARNIIDTQEGRKEMRKIQHIKIMEPFNLDKLTSPDPHKNERINRIRYYIRANRLAPKKIYDLNSATMKLVQWREFHSIVPFEFGGKEGMTIDEAKRAILQGTADLIVAVTWTQSVFLKIQARPPIEVMKGILTFLQERDKSNSHIPCIILSYNRNKEEEKPRDALQVWRELLGEVLISETEKAKGGELSEGARLIKLLLADEALLTEVVGQFALLRGEVFSKSPHFEKFGNSLEVVEGIMGKLNIAEPTQKKGTALVNKILKDRHDSLRGLLSEYGLDYLFDGWDKLSLDEQINLVYDIERINLKAVLGKIRDINYGEDHKISLEEFKEFLGPVNIDAILKTLKDIRSASRETGDML